MSIEKQTKKRILIVLICAVSLLLIWAKLYGKSDYPFLYAIATVYSHLTYAGLILTAVLIIAKKFIKSHQQYE